MKAATYLVLSFILLFGAYSLNTLGIPWLILVVSGMVCYFKAAFEILEKIFKMLYGGD